MPGFFKIPYSRRYRKVFILTKLNFFYTKRKQTRGEELNDTNSAYFKAQGSVLISWWIYRFVFGVGGYNDESWWRV